MSDRPTKRTGSAAAAAEPSWFLLFGGLHQESIGGLRSVRGVFDSEEEARGAFRRLRLEHRSAPGWGELVALDRAGRVKALCWFGVPSEAVVAAHPAGSGRSTEAPGAATEAPGVPQKGRLRRRLGRASSPGPPEGVRAASSP
ncbi:MAG TPA: hypothetical protein VHF00_04610 [Acidimicrobiales bacterium]|jgi:hypothetical protein|nr:hypothetical protein [Acidimicrobiales bacterium]